MIGVIEIFREMGGIEFHLLPVLLIDHGNDGAVREGTRRYLHFFGDIIPCLIRQTVYYRQMHQHIPLNGKGSQRCQGERTATAASDPAEFQAG